jgi:hypothetical protein
MTQGETPVPQRLPGAAGDERCGDARARVAELLTRRRTLADEPGLREHLAACEDCNAAYRERLLADARWRRTLAEAEQGEPETSAPGTLQRRAVLSPLAIARAGFSSAGRGKTTWVVLLAVVCYAVVRLTPDPAGVARAELSALEGTVASLGDPLSAGDPGRELQRGDWVRTALDSRARLALGHTVVVVAESSVVQVEEPATRRLRLESGTLEVRGPLVVTTRLGLVEVERGEARVTLDEHGCSVVSRDGSVRTVDAHGERAFVGGQSARLDDPR